MIYITALRFYASDDISRDKLSEGLRPKGVGKSLSAERERVAARILLSSAYRDIFGGELPELAYSEYGKPSLSGTPVSFSLSHTDGLALVVFSDEGKSIGADTERITDGKRLVSAVKRFAPEKYISYLEKRFLKDESPSHSPEYRFMFYRIEDGEARLAPENLGIALLSLDSEADSFVIREMPYDEVEGAARIWCTTEALLKAEGRGFCGYRREDVTGLASSYFIKSVFLTSGGESFALSVAEG